MVATLKGKLTIDSKPDAGTVVKVRVPVQPGEVTGDNS
jgi:signal transduction histidine kinase